MQSLFSSGLNQPPRVTKARLITPSVRGSHPVRSISLVADLFPGGKSLPIWIFTIPQRNYGNIFCFRRVLRGGAQATPLHLYGRTQALYFFNIPDTPKGVSGYFFALAYLSELILTGALA